MSDSLGTSILEEQNRARKVLTEYENIGPAGIFGAAVIKASIKQSEEAVASGDVVSMVVAYRDLKDIS